MTWKELEKAIKKMPKRFKDRQVKIYGYGWSMYSTYFEPDDLKAIKSTPELMRKSYGHEVGIDMGIIEEGEPFIDLGGKPTSGCQQDIRHKYKDKQINRNHTSSWKQRIKNLLGL